MKPFTYQAPTSVAEAVVLLNRYSNRAKPLAGGTDLLVQLRNQRFELDVVVDVKRIPELRQITFDPDSGLTFGAAVTCAELCEHPAVRMHYPGLVDAASIIGGVAIQGRATIGGNLCNAAPSGDSIPALITLDAICTVAGPVAWREIVVADFCTGPGKTVLSPDELLVSIHLAPPAPRSGVHYLRFIPRGEMDIAVAGAGAFLALDEDGETITNARIALAAVAPVPLLVPEAGEALTGRSATEEAFAHAAARAQEAACPIDDVRGGLAQRRHLVGVLVRRALRGALERAQGGKSYGA